MQKSNSTHRAQDHLVVKIRTDLPTAHWVVDWSRVQTHADVLDLLWQLTRGIAWMGEEPPSGISHLVKRHGS
jgi:hypothetical protein